MKRVDFLKKSGNVCLAASLGSAINFLEGCQTTSFFNAQVNDKKISVPVSKFSEADTIIIRVKSLEFDVALVKVSAEKFNAFELKCTHASNALFYNGKAFKCPLHGSLFAKDGQVTKGPAQSPLSIFKTVVNIDNIDIFL